MKYLEERGAKSVLSSRQRLEQQSLDVRWKDAVEIDICAYYANMLISSDHINQALSQGVHIRYLIVDPECPAADNALKYYFKNAQRSMYKYSVATAAELLHFMNGKDDNSAYDRTLLNGRFEVRMTTLFIGQAIMVVKKKEESENTVKVDFYTIETDDTHRRSVIIPFADKKNYKFFTDQFDLIWNHEMTKELI